MTKQDYYCCDCDPGMCQHDRVPCRACSEKRQEDARLLGALGGKAGTGKAKRRGDSKYYRKLRRGKK